MYMRFQVRNLCIIYLLCAVLAMVIVSLLLDPIHLGKEKVRYSVLLV